MTEKRYILETPAEIADARAVIKEGGIMPPETEKAVGFLVGKFMAPMPKSYLDKFKWMKDCAQVAAVGLSMIPNPQSGGFYRETLTRTDGKPGTVKVTTYDAPDGVPETARALGMTVEDRAAPGEAQDKKDIAPASLSAAVSDLAERRAAEIYKAFRPMILPIWGEED